MSGQTDEHDHPPASRRPMSADQIRHQTFREAGVGRRGYRPEDVDLFLGLVAGEVEWWNAACANAQAEIHRLREYFREHPVDAESIRVRVLSTEAVHVLARAQQQADRLLAEAQTHARAVQMDARARAEAIVADARREIDVIDHAARARADSERSATDEHAERLAAYWRGLIAALGGALAQMDGAREQMRAVLEGFTAELNPSLGGPAESHVGRAAAPLPGQGQQR